MPVLTQTQIDTLTDMIGYDCLTPHERLRPLVARMEKAEAAARDDAAAVVIAHERIAVLSKRVAELEAELPSDEVHDAVSDLVTHEGDYADAVARVSAWLASVDAVRKAVAQ